MTGVQTCALPILDIDAFKAAAEKAYTDLNMVDLRDRIQSEMASVA